MDTADPVTLIDALDPEQIAARLDDLDRQQAALRILLRAARARQREQRRATEERQEVSLRE